MQKVHDKNTSSKILRTIMSSNSKENSSNQKRSLNISHENA